MFLAQPCLFGMGLFDFLDQSQHDRLVRFNVRHGNILRLVLTLYKALRKDKRESSAKIAPFRREPRSRQRGALRRIATASLASHGHPATFRFVRSVSDSPSTDTGRPGNYFATTQWTMVLNAQRNDSTHARQAMEQLCRTYWYPLYAYVRRRGRSPEDAEDSTQGFFARLLQLNSLADVRREKGKFRSFLLASLNHYLSDEWDRARAQKRGYGQVVSFDKDAAEERLLREPAQGVLTVQSSGLWPQTF